ncbi:sugar transferase [Arthrobacter sp. AB6]|uniref:sugar transferase n=1 Tax=Arthrobacter sp. AB6 TaxID=2962570 RepID=UPI0028810D2A|nr:sugar transferase [Arthrobacter sp. AB6]MDT0193798.1 sugar transferase [Arthrobacter sp. AB6]
MKTTAKLFNRLKWNQQKENGPIKVLMITQWFDPEPTFKGLLFAQELMRAGYKVTVLTGFPNYPGGKLYEGYRIKLFQREVIDGVTVIRVPLYPSHDSSGLKRALNYLSFAFSASVGALIIKRPNVAYIYHPPATVGVPAIILKAVKGVPYVYDVQDLWPDTLAATGMLDSPRILAAIDRIMLAVYKGATRIVVLSQGFREAIIQRSVALQRIEVIPNWADEKQIDLTLGEASSDSNAVFGNKFTITFAGNIGKAQALETVLDAADLLRDEESVQFLIVGGGLELDKLQALASSKGLRNVVFLPRRPISEIGEILVRSHALLVHLRDDPLFSITIPSKTQAYMMAGRPILMGVRGDSAEIIAEAGAGLCFEPENPVDLSRAVRRLLAMDTSDREEMGSSGQRYYRERLSLSVGSRRFADVLRTASEAKTLLLRNKRFIDMGGAALGLLLLSAPMGVVALLVRKKMGRPVLFTQVRPGLHGQPFKMFKFRTMVTRTDDNGVPLPDGQRLTKFGAWLRSSSLDELPELWNVLRGDMSLVGPRPLLARYTPYFTETERARLEVRPGITGWAQVNGRNAAAWDDRLALDVWYVRHMSLALDLKILALTVSKVFRKQGVIADPESVMQNLDDERRLKDQSAGI